MRKIRIAVCQIECHPAIFVSHVDYLSEPFVPGVAGASLAGLCALGLDVAALQDTCRSSYLAWQATRLRAVVRFLDGLDPAPDLVLFPELAVPVEGLSILGEWAARHGATVLAGSHGLQTSAEARKRYQELGIKGKTVQRLRASNVMPILAGDKASLHAKQIPSVFEQSMLAFDSSGVIPKISPIECRTCTAVEYAVLPVICSEALNQFNVRAHYDVAAVVAYDAKPAQFNHFIAQNVRNKKVVAFCNDGRAGGSMVHVVSDDRRKDWLSDAFPGGLPPGDIVLAVDVDLDATAVEVGVANPSQAVRLVRLAPIEYASDQPAGGVRLGDLRLETEPTVRIHRTEAYLAAEGISAFNRIRAEQLKRVDENTTEGEAWWSVIGSDCVVPEASLATVEASLAATCAERLFDSLGPSASRSPEGSQRLIAMVVECKSRAGRAAARPLTAKTPIPLPIVDREREVQRVKQFLDAREPVLQVTGLPEIGKSSAVAKALAEAGAAGTHRITLTETSSPEFVVYSVLQRADLGPKPPYADVVSVARGSDMAAALKTIRVLLIENLHHALDGSQWRDESWPELLRALTETSGVTGTKLVLESRRAVPADAIPRERIMTMAVKGLDRDQRKYGLDLLDANLRRLELAPTAFADEDKELVVSKLGGHPVAIALAADAIVEEGIEDVRVALRSGRGVYFNFVSRLVRGLHLSDEQKTLMKLLCLARGAVPRTILGAVVDFPPREFLKSLIGIAAVDVRDDSWIEPASILREFFDPQGLLPGEVEKFHRCAAQEFAARAVSDRSVALQVEAEFHAGLAGIRLSFSSELADGVLATVRELYDRGEYHQAQVLLQGLLKKRTTADVLGLAAMVEARCNNPTVALTLAKQALGRNPRNARLVTELAKIALTQHQDRFIEELLAVARTASLQDDGLLVIEGRMWLRRGDLASAERVLDRARRLSRTNPWPFYYLGITYQRQGKLDRAAETLYDGLELCYSRGLSARGPINAIRTQLGLTYLLLDRLDHAATMIEDALRDDPRRPEIIRAYAALVIKRDGISEAHKALAELQKGEIRNRFDRCEFHLLYGLFFLGIGEPENARREFENARRADSTNVFAMMKLAQTLFDIAVAKHLNGEESYKDFVADCAELVKTILSFDPDNSVGIEIGERLFRRFNSKA